MKIFETIVELAASKLSEGEVVRTKGSITSTDGLSVLYQVLTTGTGVTLANGNVAVPYTNTGGGGSTDLDWDAGTNYFLKDKVIGSDNTWYVAMTSSIGIDPTTDNGTYWKTDVANDFNSLEDFRALSASKGKELADDKMESFSVRANTGTPSVIGEGDLLTLSQGTGIDISLTGNDFTIGGEIASTADYGVTKLTSNISSNSEELAATAKLAFGKAGLAENEEISGVWTFDANPVLNNAIPLRAKNSGGAPLSVLTIGADDRVVVGTLTIPMTIPSSEILVNNNAPLIAFNNAATSRYNLLSMSTGDNITIGDGTTYADDIGIHLLGQRVFFGLAELQFSNNAFTEVYNFAKIGRSSNPSLEDWTIMGDYRSPMLLGGDETYIQNNKELRSIDAAGTGSIHLVSARPSDSVDLGDSSEATYLNGNSIRIPNNVQLSGLNNAGSGVLPIAYVDSGDALRFGGPSAVTYVRGSKIIFSFNPVEFNDTITMPNDTQIVGTLSGGSTAGMLKIGADNTITVGNIALNMAIASPNINVSHKDGVSRNLHTLLPFAMVRGVGTGGKLGNSINVTAAPVKTFGGTYEITLDTALSSVNNAIIQVTPEWSSSNPRMASAEVVNTTTIRVVTTNSSGTSADTDYFVTVFDTGASA